MHIKSTNWFGIWICFSAGLAAAITMNKASPAALNIAAEDLSQGRVVSEKSQNLISKIPVPDIPHEIWCRIFTKLSARALRHKARENGIDKIEMSAKPYSE